MQRSTILIDLQIHDEAPLLQISAGSRRDARG
jgi:hypothetical protein